MLITGNSDVSLYFHIPFCTRKCDYCHFFVLPDKEVLQAQYMDSLLLEWNLRLPELLEKKITTIYFGGGTPALLGAKRIGEILGWIKQSFPIPHFVEITLEANPENIDLGLMQAYKSIGINRVSIGVQTLYDPLLKILGRSHTAKKALEAIDATYRAGLSNISIDLMYDLPDQQLIHWENTLQEVRNLPIAHLSLYNLTIEPHTVFFKIKKELAARIPDEQASLQMYEMAVERLRNIGLHQYEISAFAKESFFSRHNKGYWIGRPFLGFGPSAFSYWKGKRFRNIANLSKYSKELKAGRFPIDFEEGLDPDAKQRELLAIQIRLMEGVDLDQFPNLKEDTLKTLADLQGQGFIEKQDKKLKLTKRGILFYDTVAVELI